MSRVGNSLDNRPVEYWFKILKHEYLVHIPLKDRKLQRLNDEIQHITSHYNVSRRQRCLNSLTPQEYMII